MLYDRKSGDVAHKYFYDLVDELHESDVLVFNDSRVIPARITVNGPRPAVKSKSCC